VILLAGRRVRRPEYERLGLPTDRTADVTAIQAHFAEGCSLGPVPGPRPAASRSPHGREAPGPSLSPDSATDPIPTSTHRGPTLPFTIDPRAFLPDDADAATLVGRVHDPAEGGPSVVTVRGRDLIDITDVAPTVADLFDHEDVVATVRSARGRRSWPLDDVLGATARLPETGEPGDVPTLLAPIDLQVIKAAGVTFAKSMVERVIEEQSAGDPARAESVRARIDARIGTAISTVRPGSAEAEDVKRVLVAEGLWSPYLEVGIGPDPEIFTKAPVLSAVGTGAPIGVLARSTWNNPEPEVVLAVTARGRIVGATLGNDVNLRDFEGRSALLLPEAKDNNASCAIGPFVRLFDEGFTLDAVRRLVVGLHVHGADGFELRDQSSMREMSRDVEELVAHAIGPHHRYPDGFVLFTGTLFAPTQDRDAPGMGFTHHRGDLVTIATGSLGALVNTVTSAEDAPDWTLGIRGLYEHLLRHGLLRTTPMPRQAPEAVL
jgi:fumarylacetoacetate (FAA) hydrolase family protein